jgi:hypothetical protein
MYKGAIGSAYEISPMYRGSQIVKSYRRRRIVGVQHRVVFGTRLAIEQVLAACGWSINTAFVERLNLEVVYPVSADNVPGPLSTRLHRAYQPVISTRNLFSTPRPSLLTYI